MPLSQIPLKIATNLAVLGLCTASLGCRSRDEAATLKAAQGNETYAGNDSFYQVLPNQTIAVCNGGVAPAVATNIKDAVSYWLAPLGRDKYISVVEACKADWIIWLQPSTSSYYAQTFARDGTNVARIQVGPAFIPTYTSRHEMGHVFGFCDLYNPDTCRNNTNDPAPSLMGSGNLNSGTMSTGDLAGITQMALSPALANATRSWNAFFAALKTSGAPATDDSSGGLINPVTNQMINPKDVGSQPASPATPPGVCTCIRAQEAGCGLAKDGIWLSNSFVDQGMTACSLDICTTKFAALIANQCGGKVILDPQFH